jgi:molybdopterin synthase catalytic subunit
LEPKLLVWCAISEAGASTLFIGTVKGQAVDADVYITKYQPKKSSTKMTKKSFGPLCKEIDGLVGAENIKIAPKADSP